MKKGLSVKRKNAKKKEGQSDRKQKKSARFEKRKRKKKGTIVTNLHQENVRKRKKNVQFGRKRSVKRRKLAIKKKGSDRKRKKSALFEKRKSVKPKQERENDRKRKKREEFEKRKKSRVERKRKMKGGSVKTERGGKKRNEKRSRKRLKKNLWILKSLKMTARMTLKLRLRRKTTLLTTTKRKCLFRKKAKAGNGNLTKKNLLLMTAMRTSKPNLILRKSLLLNPKKVKSERSLNLMRKRISSLPRSRKSLHPRNSQSSKKSLNPKTSPKSNKKPKVQLKKGVKSRKKKKKLRFGNGGKRMVMTRKKMTEPNGISWNIRVHFLLQPTNHCPKLSDFSIMAKKCVCLKIQRRWQVSTVEC